ncbi:MAG: hypothetical protein KDC25_10755, partial [Saprospiraceae bacterium]|nr:hypothetical protein [Saprospiraceae bacterium]
NQWFTETIETIRTSGLTLIISTIRFYKTYTAECGFNDIVKKCVFSWYQIFLTHILINGTWCL